MEVAATTQYFHNVKTSTRSLIYLLSVWSVSSFLATSSNDKVNIKNSDKSFFEDVDNPVNQYLVKYAWGWTFYPLCILFTVTSFTQSGKLLNGKNIASWVRLILNTGVWYFFAVYLFPSIQQQTGVCEASKHVTRYTCYKAGYRWSGFDISGHCFLLTWNNLVIIEELQRIAINTNMTDKSMNLNFISVTVKNVLYVLMIVWEVMILATSMYFHTTVEKVLGVLCAIIPWIFIYKLLPVIGKMMPSLLKYPILNSVVNSRF